MNYINKITTQKIEEAYRPTIRILAIVSLIGIVCSIGSFIVWIWLGFTFFYKTFLTGLILMIPSYIIMKEMDRKMKLKIQTIEDQNK